MSTGEERRRELSCRMSGDELKENNRDVRPLAPMLQTVRHRSRKEGLAHGPLGSFERGQVSCEELDAVDIILKTAAGTAVGLVVLKPLPYTLARQRILTLGQERWNAQLWKLHVAQ